MSKREVWSTKIRVGDAIVDLLSGRIYRTLPIALKELISNAWDADAENVEIYIHEDKKQLIIIDDGDGMTREELENYVNIAITLKSQNLKTNKRRPLIGHYGIGVFSALPFCEKITVQTTKKNSDEINYISINSGKWIDSEGHRKPTTSKELNVVCPGRTEYDKRLKQEHGTTILLENIFPAEWKMIISKPARPKKSKYLKFSGIERIKWFLQQYTPIEYKPDKRPYVDFSPPPKSYKSMSLFLNGEKLYRNAIENAKELERGEDISLSRGKIKFRYQIVSPMETIEPEELRGLQIRMKNVAIGLPRHFDIYSLSAHLYGRMRYIGGEIEILKGFENQLSLDRENIITCPEWIEFSKFFRELLGKTAKDLEDLGKAEAMVGALAVSSGVSPQKAQYGFLSKKAVRASTKNKRASLAKSKKELVLETKKSLERVGYSIKVAPRKKDVVSVDHKKKIVYVSPKKKKKTPIIKLKKISIFELEKDIKGKEIARMTDKKTIAFNYNNPIFSTSKDSKTIKELVSLVYLLHSDKKLSSEGLKAFNRYILELYEKNKKKED